MDFLKILEKIAFGSAQLMLRMSLDFCVSSSALEQKPNRVALALMSHAHPPPGSRASTHMEKWTTLGKHVDSHRHPIESNSSASSVAIQNSGKNKWKSR